MALPGVNVNKTTNGGLGLVSAAPSKALVVGPSSGGIKERLYTFAKTSDINSTIGYGPVQEAAEYILGNVGGSIDVIVASGSIAGSSSTPLSSSAPAITKSGTPYTTFQFIGQVTTAGTLDVGRWKFSRDGGETWSPDLPIVGSYSPPGSGVTYTFPTASYPAGQTFTQNHFAPQMNSADATTALNAATGSLTTPTLLLLANDSQSAVSGAALFTVADTWLVNMDNNFHVYTQAVVPAGGTDGGTAATLAAFSSKVCTDGQGIVVSAERDRIQLATPLMGYSQPRVPFAYKSARRKHANIVNGRLSTSSGFVGDGALDSISDPTYAESVNGEVYKPANIEAPTYIPGKIGTFLTVDLLKTQPGSDYKYWPWIVVINRAAAVVDQGLSRYINADLEAKTDGTGQITEPEAKLVEADINSQLQAALVNVTNGRGRKGYVSGVLFSVDRTTNIVSTSTLDTATVIVPRPVVERINANLAFSTSIPVSNA